MEEVEKKVITLKSSNSRTSLSKKGSIYEEGFLKSKIVLKKMTDSHNIESVNSNSTGRSEKVMSYKNKEMSCRSIQPEEELMMLSKAISEIKLI